MRIRRLVKRWYVRNVVRNFRKEQSSAFPAVHPVRRLLPLRLLLLRQRQLLKPQRKLLMYRRL